MGPNHKRNNVLIFTYINLRLAVLKVLTQTTILLTLNSYQLSTTIALFPQYIYSPIVTEPRSAPVVIQMQNERSLCPDLLLEPPGHGWGPNSILLRRFKPRPLLASNWDFVDSRMHFAQLWGPTAPPP